MAATADDAVAASDGKASGGAVRWRQADIKQVIAAAENAGLQSYRVEIAPGGTITIVVGAPPSDPPLPDDYQDLMDL